MRRVHSMTMSMMSCVVIVNMHACINMRGGFVVRVVRVIYFLAGFVMRAVACRR